MCVGVILLSRSLSKHKWSILFDANISNEPGGRGFQAKMSKKVFAEILSFLRVFQESDANGVITVNTYSNGERNVIQMFCGNL